MAGVGHASEFLIMKSTEQQKKEGVERPIDTAYIEPATDGALVLKAVFDIQHFKEEEVSVRIEERRLVVTAQGLTDNPTTVYRKTLLRTLDLPEQADTSAISQDISADGILTVQMPFHLPQRQPAPNPALVPIINDNGRRKICLQFMIGPDFAMDDIKVNTNGQILEVSASYEAELGVDGAQVTRRELNKKFIIPECIEVEEFKHTLLTNGILCIEILIKDDNKPRFRCSVTTEDVTGQVDQLSHPS